MSPQPPHGPPHAVAGRSGAAAPRRARLRASLLVPLLAVLVSTGCTTLGGPAPADSAGPPGTTDMSGVAGSGQATATPLGVVVEIDAPPPLKTLLERHLDIVRLGRIAREEVDDSEWSRLIEATPAQVKELLQTEGYFAPTVTLERQALRQAGAADRVTLRVTPGPRARVSRVTLAVEGALDRDAASGDPEAVAALERWRKAWPLPAGSEFRNPGWNQAKTDALSKLRAAGYATATWSGTAADIDLVRNEVRLFLVIDSGPLFRLGEFHIDGLVTHDAETVRHIANVPRGAPITERFLLDYQERLVKSRLFESVNVLLEPDPATADAAAVSVRLREAPQQAYTFGVGVSANTGLRVSLDHVHRRVFDWPAMAYNSFEFAQLRRAWEGEISSHPGEKLYRYLVGGAIEWLQSDSDVVQSQRLRAGRARDTSRFEQLSFVEIERSERETDVERTSTTAISANVHGVWRKVDSVILPTEGFTFAGEGGFGRSRGTASETGWFTRAYGRLTGYLPFAGWYGQARFEIGKVFLDPAVLAPESQRWRAGGDDSVRGYQYRSLGPLDPNGDVESGNVIMTTSLELARPFSANLPSVLGAVFVDAGNAANSFSGLKLALGYGVGVRWRSPVGPLRVDIAYGEEERRWRLHFSVGIVY
jgi:translocation and assembly module TamA